MKVAKAEDNIPEWAKGFPWFLINEFCTSLKVDKFVVASIIKVESNGNPWVSRFESKIKTFYLSKDHAKATGQSEITEQIHQGMSFGLMQVLGLTARRMGFDQPLGRLFDVPTNLYYGCTLLAELRGRYESQTDQIAAYNAGRPTKETSGMYTNQTYVDRVMIRYREMIKLIE
jgi:hypothetical protein